MGALAKIRKYFNKSIMGIMLGSSFGALVNMVNLTGEVNEESVKVAMEETIWNNKNNPELIEDVNNFAKIYEISERISRENVEKQFDTTYTFSEENGKDKDGYNKIEDKLLKAKVSTETINEKPANTGDRPIGGEEREK